MRNNAFKNVEIVVKQSDALAVPADVLALKYANALYGVDRAAIEALLNDVPDIGVRMPKPSGFYISPTTKAVAASQVLFVGVGPLRLFGYGEIQHMPGRYLKVSRAKFLRLVTLC